MALSRTKKALLWSISLVLLLAFLWLANRILDPTSSALFIADSPDGKYRVAIFETRIMLIGNSKYQAALFSGTWPHRQFKGPRVLWDYDSVCSSDFVVTWQPNGADVTFNTGYGTDRATIPGRLTAGTQSWTGPR